MSKITRRDFLKTAGVMTLAVAAAGVLSGCEGNANKPGEEVVITKNSVTVGDHTLTIKEAKQFAVKTLDANTHEVTTEERYVAVLVYLKDNANKTGNKATFNMKVKATNLTVNDFITAKGIKKQFDLKVDAAKLIKFANDSTFNRDVTNDTADGQAYYYVAKVDKYEDNTFKTPAISLIVDDQDKKVYTTLDVVIPAAVDTLKKDLVIS